MSKPSGLFVESVLLLGVLLVAIGAVSGFMIGMWMLINTFGLAMTAVGCLVGGLLMIFSVGTYEVYVVDE